MAMNFSGRKVLNDILRNCSECLVPAFKDGCSVVWTGLERMKKDSTYFTGSEHRMAYSEIISI